MPDFFQSLYEGMGSEHTALLLHRNKVALEGKSVCQVLGFIQRILLSLWSTHLMSDCLKSITWLQTLPCLADIFTITDKINISLQGRTFPYS
jgi:hypothetical protein